MVCLWKRHPPHDASSYKRSQIRSPSHYLFLQQLSQQPRDLKTSQAPIMSLAWSFLFSLPFLLLLSTLNSVAFSVPVLRHRRSDTTTYNPPTESYEYTVCKRDHLVITASSESDSFPFLTVPSDNQLSEVRLGAVNQKMSRKDLFSFESIDLQNHQWVLRTSDNSHLAIDDKGKLIVESGCITTTFLRIVAAKHLEKCMEGVACTMALCGTTIGINKSYIVSSDYSKIQPHALPSDSCATHRDFHQSINSSGNSNLEPYEVTVRSAVSLRHRASRGLKKLCPHLYDSTAAMAATTQMCKSDRPTS